MGAGAASGSTVHTLWQLFFAASFEKGDTLPGPLSTRGQAGGHREVAQTVSESHRSDKSPWESGPRGGEAGLSWGL